MPSTVLRMSIGGRPRPFGAGNNDASTVHCSSVISCRIAMAQHWRRGIPKPFTNTPSRPGGSRGAAQASEKLAHTVLPERVGVIPHS
jgi:hypothetical protein